MSKFESLTVSIPAGKKLAEIVYEEGKQHAYPNGSVHWVTYGGMRLTTAVLDEEDVRNLYSELRAVIAKWDNDAG